jgi:hypothetical protein
MESPAVMNIAAGLSTALRSKAISLTRSVNITVAQATISLCRRHNITAPLRAQ